MASSAVATDLEEDEAGIWMLVEEQERLLRTSPVRLEDVALEAHLNEISCTVSPDTCDASSVYVLRLPGFNAFMMANGAMFIQSGLLLRVQSESELASVIGHEIAHFTERHSIENIRRWRNTRNTYAVLGAIIGAAGSVGAASASTYEGAASALDLSNTALTMLQTAAVFSSLQLIAYGRDDEREADDLGLRSVVAAGYDANSFSQVWERYLAEHRAAGNEGAFSLLATHPTPEERVRNMKALAGELGNDSSPAVDQSNRLFELIEPHRNRWLELEAQSIHPAQFEELIKNQPPSIADGHLHYLAAEAWKRWSERQLTGKRKRKEFLENAVKNFELGDQSESGLPNEAYRDWARVSLELGDTNAAISGFREYLKRSPGAWDARFVAKDLQRLQD